MFFTAKGDSPKVLFLQLFCHEAKQVLASADLCSTELLADLKCFQITLYHGIFFQLLRKFRQDSGE